MVSCLISSELEGCNARIWQGMRWGLWSYMFREGAFYKACYDIEGCYNKVRFHFSTVQSVTGWYTVTQALFKSCYSTSKRKWKAVVLSSWYDTPKLGYWINQMYPDVHASRSIQIVPKEHRIKKSARLNQSKVVQFVGGKVLFWSWGLRQRNIELSTLKDTPPF